MNEQHVPVMVSEVLDYLLTESTRVVVDGTIGAGGHAAAILEARDDVSVIGIDRDPSALEIARGRLSKFEGRVTYKHCVFSDIDAALAGVGSVDGVLLDLGVSSMQIDVDTRGFSHQQAGPLDMRMGAVGETVSEFIANNDATTIAGVLRQFGEIRQPKKIARAIKRASDEGALDDTLALRNVITDSFGGYVHPSVLSRIFQAFRIAVNDELGALNSFLGRILRNLSPGARIVIISYHSLEDRLVKRFFRDQSAACVCPPSVPVCVCRREPSIAILTRKAVRPSDDEVSANPRARSARLRAAQVLGKEAVS